jgi:hypothetical protein
MRKRDQIIFDLAFFRKTGAQGGKSRSAKKLKAVRANAAKARAALARKLAKGSK